MSAKIIEFLFDFGSPATYLAHTQMPRLAADTGARVDYVPMLLGGVFKATGNQSPMAVPAKGRWMGRDLARWAGRYGVPFAFNPHFPVNTLTLMRGAVAVQARQPGRFMPYVDAVFRAMWVEPVDLGDPAVLASTLQAAGFDPHELLAMVGDAEVKARLIANTEAAVARGVFGAPTFFVGSEMYFGQDRLDFVREAALHRGRP
ncbi:MAG: 2-hydroxychromene-2-carboxylate isomerase [Burkholderiaceae bacterium]|nr:2-hydroxychromene-2-carboxylate isomerase [Burkholderiaceae bacterium]